MTAELIERVAKAICYWHNPKHGSCFDNFCVGQCRAARPNQEHYDQAKAALIASSIQSLSDRIAVLEDSVVSLWHDCPSEDRSLNECLGLSREQYQTWVKTASLTPQEPK